MTTSTQANAASDKEVDRGGIALCLSGGGLRATLFHLGLIRVLRQARFNGAMALTSVREIFAVSGGSILAAHFLANYTRYVDDDPSVFVGVERELLSFANRDLRNRVLRRWPLHVLRENPRGHLLQAEYHRFLDEKTIGQCYTVTEQIPTFHFLSTSFTNGALCSFSRTVFEQVDRGAGNATISTAADGLPLAFAVAASSAFPPMFPPMRLSPEALGTDGSPPFNAPMALSDGGVFDNFGIDKFCLAQRKDPRPGILIVSNAGGSFATDPEHSYQGMLSRNIRASDILMRRIGDTTLEVGEKLVGRGLVLVRIGRTVPDPMVAETTQLRFRLVRTDLDRFENTIAMLIADHGARVARAALTLHRLAGNAPSTFEFEPEPSAYKTQAPSLEQTYALTRELSAASRRRCRHLFFDVRDGFYFILWWAIGLLALTGFCLLIYSGISFVAAKHEAEVAKQKATAALAEAVAEGDRRAIAKAVSDARLELVRTAAVNSDMAEVRRTLAIAIETSKDLAERPNNVNPIRATAIAPARVDQIIDTPVVPTLPRVTYPQKVYIQFAGAFRREQITTLNQMLRQAGWAAQGPSGERTLAAAGMGEVRYAGNNAAAGQALADALNQSGLPIRRVTPRYNSNAGDNLKVWISN